MSIGFDIVCRIAQSIGYLKAFYLAETYESHSKTYKSEIEIIVPTISHFSCLS